MSDRHLVSVEWHDAHQVTDTWTQIGDLDDAPCVVVSAGWLIPHAKPGHVVLAQSCIDAQDDVDGVLAIPNGMVRRIHHLSATGLIPVEPSPDE